MRERKSRLYRKYIKRVIDFVLSLILCVLLLLPMLLIATAIRIDSEGGAIFKQTRRGYGGRKFTCYKFRTMYKDAPRGVPASEFKDYGRYVTRVGNFLRRTGFDELPQLYNVVKGDMSLVGPRPLIPEEENMHRGREQSGVYDLRPGITGMAQVCGRNKLSDAQKIERDVYYMNNMRFLLDARIAITTFTTVIKSNKAE